MGFRLTSFSMTLNDRSVPLLPYSFSLELAVQNSMKIQFVIMINMIVNIYRLCSKSANLRQGV